MSQELIPAFPVITKDTDIGAKFLNTPAVLEKLDSILEMDIDSVTSTEFILKHLKEVFKETNEMDPETKEGYEAIKALANKIVKVRTNSKTASEELAKPFKDATSLISTEFKSLEKELTALETPLKDKYQAIDKRKKEQEAAEDQYLRDCLEWIKNAAADSISKTSAEIEELIEEVSSIDMGDNWKKYLELAVNAQQATLDSLANALPLIIQNEQNQAELEKLKASQKDSEEVTAPVVKTKASQKPPQEQKSPDPHKPTKANFLINSEDFSRFCIEDLLDEELAPGEYQVTITKV